MDIPVIGIGGITSPEDAIEFIIAGASAIEIGTYNFVNPRVTMDVIDGVERYLVENKIKTLPELIGTFQVS